MGKRLVSLLLAAVAGLAFWAAFPVLGVWPLGLVSVGLLWFVLSWRERTGFWFNGLLGFVAGAGFFGPHLYWTSIATALVSWFALTLLQAWFWAMLGSLWAWAIRIPWLRVTPWRQALAFAVLFTGVEQWRSSVPFGGFPWGRLAWTVAGATPGRAAWLGGSVLVTFILAFAASLVAVTACEAFRAGQTSAAKVPGDQVLGTQIAIEPGMEHQVSDGGQHRVRFLGRYLVTPNLRLRIAALAAVLMLFTPALIPLAHDGAATQLARRNPNSADPEVIGGAWPGRREWVNAGVATAEVGVVQVGIVQGNVPRVGGDPAFNANEVFWNHLNTTQQLADDNFYRIARSSLPDDPAAQGAMGFDVIVWPENSAAWDPVQWPTVAGLLDEFSEAAAAPIMIGSMEYPDSGGRYNVSLLWDANGGLIGRYAKQIPAPFGEYIPFRNIARMLTDQVDRLPIDMYHADNPPVITWYVDRLGQYVTMGIGICFEVAYDHIFFDAVRHGAEFLVIPTNNASFGDSPQSDQQLQMTQMQAITTGRAAIQISTVGVSGVVAPDGQLVAVTGLWEQDRISALLPLRTSITPAVRIGMAPSYLVQFLALALPLSGLVLGLRQRKSVAL